MTDHSCALYKRITNLKGKTIAHDLHSVWIADLLNSEINLLPASQEHVQHSERSDQWVSFLYELQHLIRVQS